VAEPHRDQCRDGRAAAQEAPVRRPYPELEDDTWQPPADASADPSPASLTSSAPRAEPGAVPDHERQRTAIVLYDVEGYDYAEIAEMTACRSAR
jgi:DNA-directed RNA polymerase specialized sigma24 family protein